MTSQIVPTLDHVIGQTRAVAVLRTAIDSFFYDRTKATDELAFPHLLISGPAGTRKDPSQ
jgi:holliday junction DNA helicase RuvB